MQAVHQESDVIPENIDAIRALLEMESDNEKSIAKLTKLWESSKFPLFYYFLMI